MGFTGDNRVKKKTLESGNTKGILGGWITASPTQSSPRPDDTARDALDSSAKSPTSGTRFGFLNSITRLTPSVPDPSTTEADDDALLELDIEAALFPNDTSKDAFSPAAFKNLQLNAIGLLTKFQDAHRRRTAETKVLRAEHEASADEREEVETRVTHLKHMLEEMAQKAAEQEQVMQHLLEELAVEKERNSRSAEEASILMSEDLGFDDAARSRQMWRKSNASTTMSLDTDTDSFEEASLFSQSRSPTVAPSMFEGSIGSRSPGPSVSSSRVPSLLPPKSLPQPRSTPAPAQAPPQMTAFQKLFKGISGDSARAVNGCQNCQGQTTAMAWDTVNLLKDENRGLKQRVEDLEAGVEAALDMVNGVGSCRNIGA